jgi:hypothetical protein
MQNVSTQTRPFPSWAAIAAGLLALVAAAVLLVYFAQLGHQSPTTSSATAVTKSAGSELVRHNTSERNGVPEQPVDMRALRQYGPR